MNEAQGLSVEHMVSHLSPGSGMEQVQNTLQNHTVSAPRVSLDMCWVLTRKEKMGGLSRHSQALSWDGPTCPSLDGNQEHLR